MEREGRESYIFYVTFCCNIDFYLLGDGTIFINGCKLVILVAWVVPLSVYLEFWIWARIKLSVILRSRLVWQSTNVGDMFCLFWYSTDGVQCHVFRITWFLWLLVSFMDAYFFEFYEYNVNIFFVCSWYIFAPIQSYIGGRCFCILRKRCYVVGVYFCGAMSGAYIEF